MTETKRVRISLKNRVPGTVLHGARTILEIDGQPVPDAHALRIEVVAGRLAKVSIDYFADVDIEGDLDPEQIEIKPVYALGSAEPRRLVKVKKEEVQ